MWALVRSQIQGPEAWLEQWSTCFASVNSTHTEKDNKFSQVWWHMSVNPAPEKLRQGDGEFGASLGYIARPCFKQSKIKQKILRAPFTPVESEYDFSQCGLVANI
jgi:hypothetical protein